MGSSRGGRGEWNNGHGGRGGRGAANNAVIHTGGGLAPYHVITSEDGVGLTLNKEQFGTLVQLLNTTKSSSADRLSGMIIDTGASHHLTGCLELLFDVHNISPCPIELPNGDIN